MKFQAHDLLWVSSLQDALFYEGYEQEWLQEEWNISYPLVVRRDELLSISGRNNQGSYLIPAGIRGKKRDQRQALWVPQTHILKIKKPSEIVLLTNDKWAVQNLTSYPAFQALTMLIDRIASMQNRFSIPIGVSGSLAFSLAVREVRISLESDLDLTLNCREQQEKTYFNELQSFLMKLPCRVDVQIETPLGGFSLLEWLSGEEVLLKTNTGPVLTRNPWHFIKP